VNEFVVKYAWQMGPFKKNQADCVHRSDKWPHSDLWKPFYCKGDLDKCLCPDCGAVHEHPCSFDEGEYK
jgi:hypothetical protein